jgi:glucoamylase
MTRRLYLHSDDLDTNVLFAVWSNTVNLPAGSSVQYKYYRKNADASVTWENLPGGGNRTLNVPASGGTALSDTVGW